MQDRTNPTARGSACAELDDAVQRAWPFETWRQRHVVLAVSGGVDSVALLRSLLRVRSRATDSGDTPEGSLWIAHYDHSTRGERSADDAAWVEQLARSVNVPVLVGRAESCDDRSEAALRAERRAFYEQAARQTGARYVATAHTADDQAETVLFRLLRGAGVRGLAGIRPVAPLTDGCTLVRPLLRVRRELLARSLAEAGQPHQEDATNASIEPTRNWLRHEVLPKVEERFPQARDQLAATAEHAAETDALVATLAEALLDRATAVRDDKVGSIRLEIGVLRESPPLLAAEAIRLAWRHRGWPEAAMTREHWRSVLAVATDPSDAAPITLPGAIRVVRRDGVIAISPADAEGTR